MGAGASVDVEKFSAIKAEYETKKGEEGITDEALFEHMKTVLDGMNPAPAAEGEAPAAEAPAAEGEAPAAEAPAEEAPAADAPAAEEAAPAAEEAPAE